MFRIYNCLATQHDWRLVCVAAAVCFIASLSAISLFHRSRANSGRTRIIWIVIAGTTTGFGIWATHFIAMLAYEPGVATGYDIGLTALSFAAAATVTMHRPCRGGVHPGAMERPGRRRNRRRRRRLHALPRHVGDGGAGPHRVVVGSYRRIDRARFAVRLLRIADGDPVQPQARNNSRRNSSLPCRSYRTISPRWAQSTSFQIRHASIGASSLSPTALAMAVASAAVAILGISLISAFADRLLGEKSVMLEIAMNNMSQGLVMFDKSERLVVCNDRYIELYGCRATS